MKKHAHNDTKRKEDGLLLMNRVRANGHLLTLLEGLALDPTGKKKQQNELTMKVQSTLLYSFQSYFNCIKTPIAAVTSLLLDPELDAEGKDIVRAMLKMRSEYTAANDSKDPHRSHHAKGRQ